MALPTDESINGSLISPGDVSAALMEIGDAFMILDRKWRFVYLNQQAARKGNVKLKDLLGQNIWETYPALVHSPIHAYYHQVMENSQPLKVEMEGVQTGTWYEIRVYPVPAGIAILWLDITERRQARLEREQLVKELEDARRQVEVERARLEAVLQQMPSGVMIAEAPSGKLIFSNRQVEEIWKQPFIETENVKSYQEYKGFHPNGQPLAPDEWPLARSVKNGEVVQGEEIDFLRGDGSRGSMKVSSTPIYQNGEITAGVVILADISKQKEAERNLRYSEELQRARAAELNAVMDAVPAVIWVTHDPACLEVTGNRTAFEIFRAESDANLSLSYPQEQTGFRFRVMQNGEELRTEDLPLQISARSGQPLRNFEEEIAYDDGVSMHLFGNVTPLLDEAGQPAGAVAAFMDITPRVQAEKALLQSEQRLRVALSSVPLLLYTMDRDLRLTWLVNLPDPYDPANVLGKRLDEIFTMEEAQELIAVKRRVIETGQGAQLESSIRIGGEDVYLIATMEPVFDTKGRVTGLTGAALDVTRQRQIEAERREYQTNLEVQQRLMYFREKERQEIARDIHDGPIQSLVSTIFNIQFAREAIQDPVAKVEMEQVGLNIKNVVRELREVINELRPPSLIRFGLSKAIRIHADDFHEKHAHIQLHLQLWPDDENLSDQISLTFFRIYQEALNNVTRHSNASEVWVRFAVADDQVSLAVRDNGGGFEIPGDFIEQTIKGHFGLAGMKERAEAIGGKLTVTSINGGGTHITVTAPLQFKMK